MATQRWYLKYRPLQLDEVVGQKYVTGTLKQAAKQNAFVHSYLFSGVKGCGKTSIARILSNLLTCTDLGKDGKLCGECYACQNIPLGVVGDVIELDAGQHGKVEDIQALIDSAHWRPSDLSRKVFIIDECHMLTDRAISGLLKIVEEPPAHLVFIFCTTELRKILPTIMSRCQRFNFTRIPSKDIAERLGRIAKSEGVNIDGSALLSLAKLSRGSMRDAIGYLEQLATIGKERKLTDKHVYQYFAMADRNGIFKIVQHIASNNVTLLMDQINDLIVCGADCRDILAEIAEVFRSLMVIQTGNSKLIDLPDHEVKILQELSKIFPQRALYEMPGSLNDVERQLAFSINDRWILEAALLKCVELTK